MLELIGILLLLPALVHIVTYLFVFSLCFIFDDLDTMDTSWMTFKETFVFGYAHMFGRPLLMLGQVNAADRIYRLAGATAYRDGNSVIVESR